MNSSVYIFGNLSSGYTQYPDEDFSASIFHTFYKRAKATTQIAIHRDGHLMYYSYIRKLEQSQYIGLCVLLNDAMITNFDNMFSLFENTISNLAEKGYFIRYNENGSLVANAEKLFKKPEEIELITESLKRGFDNLSNNAQKLPPENFSVGKDSTKEFSIEDDSKDIIQSSHTNGYTFIYKSKGFNTTQMNTYIGVLARVTKENNTLKKENQNLRDENKKVKQQKKQFQYVIILFIVLLGSGIGLLTLNDNLNFTQVKLDEANDSIKAKNQMLTENIGIIAQKDNEISSLSSNISRLQSSLVDEKSKRESVEQELEDFKSSIKSSIPILITSVDIGNTDASDNVVTGYGNSIYSSNTMYLSPRIRYTGIRSGESVTLYIKLYTANGSLSTGNSSPTGYSYSKAITVCSGSDNIAYLSGWGGSTKGHWAKGSYRFEIWYGNMCLKSKSFTIY